MALAYEYEILSDTAIGKKCDSVYHVTIIVCFLFIFFYFLPLHLLVMLLLAVHCCNFYAFVSTFPSISSSNNNQEIYVLAGIYILYPIQSISADIRRSSNNKTQDNKRKQFAPGNKVIRVVCEQFAV